MPRKHLKGQTLSPTATVASSFSLASQKDHPWRRETVKGALMVMYSCVASYYPQMLLVHAWTTPSPPRSSTYSSSCQVTPGSHRHARAPMMLLLEPQAGAGESHPASLSGHCQPHAGDSSPGVLPVTQHLGRSSQSLLQGGQRWGAALPPLLSRGDCGLLKS